MNYVLISANYAAFLIAKNAAPLLPFLLHSKLPKVVYSDLPITGARNNCIWKQKIQENKVRKLR